MYWLSGCLLCSWIRRSTASCGMETLRTEVSVLGRERVNLPLGFRTYCLPMKMVLFLVSRSSQKRAAQRDVVSWVPTATNAGTDFYLVATVGFLWPPSDLGKPVLHLPDGLVRGDGNHVNGQHHGAVQGRQLGDHAVLDISEKRMVLESLLPNWKIPSGQRRRMGMASCTDLGRTKPSRPHRAKGNAARTQIQPISPLSTTLRRPKYNPTATRTASRANRNCRGTARRTVFPGSSGLLC